MKPDNKRVLLFVPNGNNQAKAAAVIAAKDFDPSCLIFYRSNIPVNSISQIERCDAVFILKQDEEKIGAIYRSAKIKVFIIGEDYSATIDMKDDDPLPQEEENIMDLMPEITDGNAGSNEEFIPAEAIGIEELDIQTPVDDVTGFVAPVVEEAPVVEAAPATAPKKSAPAKKGPRK